MTIREQHRPHESFDHDHDHGVGCGHQAVSHDGHVDFVHNGHWYSAHDDHYDEHPNWIADPAKTCRQGEETVGPAPVVAILAR